MNWALTRLRARLHSLAADHRRATGMTRQQQRLDTLLLIAVCAVMVLNLVALAAIGGGQ